MDVEGDESTFVPLFNEAFHDLGLRKSGFRPVSDSESDEDGFHYDEYATEADRIYQEAVCGMQIPLPRHGVEQRKLKDMMTLVVNFVFT